MCLSITRTSHVVAAALLAVAPLDAGCTAPPVTDAPTGQMVLSLEQVGVGEVFHLKNAVFDIAGQGGFTQTIDGSDLSTEIDVKVPPGIASITLHDGWILEKSTDNGATFQPVSALLATVNPSSVRVLANEPVFVQFDFVVREVDGTLKVTLGVVDNPRELVGGFIVSSASDGLAGYAVPGNGQLDFAIYFQQGTVKSQTLADGTKQKIYTAGDFGVASPLSSETSAVAAEFFNDDIGTLSNKIAPQLAGAFLQYTVAAKPDGTVQLSGTIQGGNSDGFTEIDFGPNAIDVDVPALDADGFPVDEFFYDSTLPFSELSQFDQFATSGNLSGTLRMRYVPPQP